MTDPLRHRDQLPPFAVPQRMFLKLRADNSINLLRPNHLHVLSNLRFKND